MGFKWLIINVFLQLLWVSNWKIRFSEYGSSGDADPHPPTNKLHSLYLQGSEAVGYYDYYVPGGVVTSGLVAEGDTFTLNDKPILLMSGAFHYFRVHPAYWRDTFKKLRAAGLNAVET